MKGQVLNWEQFKSQNPKQTAIEFTYHNEKLDKVRIILGNFSSREEAWEFCKSNDWKRTILDNTRYGTIQVVVKLYQLSKLIRSLEETRPKNVSAIKILG